MIASDIFDPSHLSTILSEERKNSEDETISHLKILSKWIQETSNTTSNYTMLTDQLVEKLVKQTEGKEHGDLISKTIGDLMTQVCLNQMDQHNLVSSNNNKIDDYER